MLLAALSSPRTPAGGWSGDPNSSLRFPLRHRIAPPPRGLAPAEKPFVWTEVIGERYGLVTRGKEKEQSHIIFPCTRPQTSFWFGGGLCTRGRPETATKDSLLPAR